MRQQFNQPKKDLADLIDSLIMGGSEHITVSCDDSYSITAVTMNSADCCAENSACSIPTIHKDIDDD